MKSWRQLPITSPLLINSNSRMSARAGLMVSHGQLCTTSLLSRTWSILIRLKNSSTRRDILSSVGIFDMDYDMQLVVALPLLFPKTTSLEWKNESRHEFVDPEERDESTHDQVVRQWKDI